MNGRAAIGQSFQYGLAIFALTALIGLVNASKLLGTLDQATLLTHLHSGTLGWITMGVIGVAIWLFGGTASQARWVTLTALATAAYVLAFWSGNFIARAVFGAIELAVILGWWWWTLSRAAAAGFGRLEVPKWSVLLGLTTLVVGSTLGVIVQILFATGTMTPERGVLIGGHAGAQVGGYLVLVAAGIAEWQLVGASRSRAGTAQAWILFLGGILLALALLVNLEPMLGIATLLQVIGIVFVLARIGRRVLSVPWGAPSGLRFAAITVAWLVIGLVLEILLVQQFVAAQGDPSKVNQGLQRALDHTFFVGVMTNALFGTILVLTADRPRVWPWADHIIFWGVNIGVASFTAVLLAVGSSTGAAAFSHPVAYTAPIMGLSALLGIAAFLQRLREAPLTAGATVPA